MSELERFREVVWDYYHDHGRDLPWRQSESDGTFDPYKIMVSELMLQQTQVARVIPKYEQFMTAFPTTESLAAAPLADVLKQWSGLGYNRRAKFLWQAAQQVNDSFPRTLPELVALPGIGTNTAGAILAYAFNQPVVFIETNIRTVYIHHFFGDRTDVDDKELLPLIQATLPGEGKEQPEQKSHFLPGALRKTGVPTKPVLWGDSTVGLSQNREWYWALMDYGSHLKATVGNLSQNSRHYAKQSAFHGSKRQIRGQVLRLLAGGHQTHKELQAIIGDERLAAVLDDLTNEGLIQRQQENYYL